LLSSHHVSLTHKNTKVILQVAIIYAINLDREERVHKQDIYLSCSNLAREE